MHARRLALVLVTSALATCLGATPGIADTVNTFAYTVKLSGPVVANTDQSVRLTVKTARALKGKTVSLRRYRAGDWRLAGRSTLGRRGQASFHVTHSAAGTRQYRAFVKRPSATLKSNRLSVVVQAPLPPLTPPPSDQPPPTATTPLPEPAPVEVPALPALPPYPGGGGAGMTTASRDLTAVALSSLFCNTGSVGTVNQVGTGNGYEWELWIPAIYGFNWNTYEWQLLAYGNWNYRDSAPSIIGGGQSWQILPSGTANSFASWNWSVVSGHWYAVRNWRYSASAGYSWDWAHHFGDTTWPTACQAL